jgi:endonuclease YncB( thermonuclease family)
VIWVLILVGSSWAADVIVKDADVLRLGDVSFRLDGVDAPELDQNCLDENGAVWPCGTAARDELRNFIGDRTVQCEDKGADPTFRERRLGICRIEGERATLNQWLVRNGWALNFEPYAKGRFFIDQADAERNRLGLWTGCFAAPQDLRLWNKKTAKLLGLGCPPGNDSTARNDLLPEHPNMPPGCAIKGTFAARAKVTGHRGIYHMESCRSYGKATSPRRWFCTEEDARAAGFRKAYDC